MRCWSEKLKDLLFLFFNLKNQDELGDYHVTTRNEALGSRVSRSDER